MEIETLNNDPPLQIDNWSVNSSLLTFDLPTLIDKIKHSQTWADGELIAIILLKSPDKQIILTALHDRTEVNSFQSDNSVTLQIIEGKLMFHTRKESVILDEGQVLTLHENIKYRLTTFGETVFLLTIATGFLKKQKTKRPGVYRN